MSTINANKPVLDKTLSDKMSPGKPTFAKSLYIELLEVLLTSFIVLLLIQWVIALPEVVDGPSMEPTFYTNERILVEKITKHFKTFDRGTIVVLNPPGKNLDYVKRIIGVPGDVVKILDCGVYISRDGEKFKLDEPYLYSDMCTTGSSIMREGRSIRIEDDNYLVLGDNRAKSADSRIFGVISKDQIVGKVVLRFWPFSKMEMF